MIGVGMKGFEGWFVAELQFRVITVVPVALGLRGVEMFGFVRGFLFYSRLCVFCFCNSKKNLKFESLFD